MADVEGAPVDWNDISSVDVGIALGETVRTSLGPMGMDKMLVASDGEVIVTSNGSTILGEVDINHPVGRLVANVIHEHTVRVSDGSTSTMLLTASLLQAAKGLLDRGLHPMTIIDGFQEGLDSAQEALKEIAVELDGRSTDDVVDDVFGTDFSHVEMAVVKETLKRAITRVRTDQSINVDDIKIISLGVGTIDDIRLIEGVVLEETPHVGNADNRLEDASVVVLDCPVLTDDRQTLKQRPQVDVDSAESYLRTIDEEIDRINAVRRRLQQDSRTIVVSRKGINDKLADASNGGLVTVERVPKADIERLAKATGARVVSDIEYLSSDCVGRAGRVEIEELNGEENLVVDGCSDPGSVTLLVTGTPRSLAEDIERSMRKAIGVVRLMGANPSFVPGGGAAEMAAARRVRSGARGVSGRRQFAIEAFADALEQHPRTLAETFGMDPIDAIVALRSSTTDDVPTGLVPDRRNPVDPMAVNIVDLHRVKRQSFDTSVELANQLLRIKHIHRIKDDERG